MFLSRMELNPRRRGAQKLLSSPQAMHAAVMAAFPPDAAVGDDSRILWRFDSESVRNLLYVVSPTEPCFLHLQEQAGWSTCVTWATKAYGPFLDRLAEGQAYSFRLTANPTRVVTSEDGRKARVGFFREDAQVDWLLGKATEMGVTFGQGDQAGMKVKQARSREFKRSGGTVTILQATFEGGLIVRDALALRGSLVAGVGRAKAYGCGLLTLAGLPQ